MIDRVERVESVGGAFVSKPVIESVGQFMFLFSMLLTIVLSKR